MSPKSPFLPKYAEVKSGVGVSGQVCVDLAERVMDDGLSPIEEIATSEDSPQMPTPLRDVFKAIEKQIDAGKLELVSRAEWDQGAARGHALLEHAKRLGHQNLQRKPDQA